MKLAHTETGLSPPVKYFTGRLKAVLLLWIFSRDFLSYVRFAFVRVCLYVPYMEITLSDGNGVNLSHIGTELGLIYLHYLGR